jgi:hypothetical protein
MTTLTPSDQELVTALSETIAFHFPDRNQTPDEHLLQRWNQELVDADCPAGSIMAEAMELWRANDDPVVTTTNSRPTATVTATSFSLMDFGGGGLSSRIFLEDVEEAIDKLAVLQQVDHVDDISMDWDYIQGLLSEGIASDKESLQYIDICIAWFDQGDGTVQLNITDLVSEVVVLKDHEVGSRLLQVWRYMWVKLFDKSLDQRRMESIAIRVLALLKSNERMAFYLAALDPTSVWFHVWVQEQSPLILRGLIAAEHGLISTLFRRCEDSSLKRALRDQSISMLNIVMLQTRVSQFPWEGGFPQIDRIVSIMLDSRTPAGDLTDIGAQAMDTILWGCYQDESLYEPVIQHLLKLPELPSRLLDMLKLLQTAMVPTCPLAVKVEQVTRKSRLGNKQPTET